MNEFVAAAYCAWLNGTPTILRRPPPQTGSLGEATSHLIGLSIRARRAIIRAFANVDAIDLSLLSSNPETSGLKPLRYVRNCGDTTLAEIGEWADEHGFAIHPSHFC